MIPSHRGGRRGGFGYRGGSRGASTGYGRKTDASLDYNESGMQVDHSSEHPIRVTGFTELEDVDHLLRFLRSKAERPFQVSSVARGAAAEVIITVPGDKDANLLLQLSGIRYFGEKLLIQPIGERASARPITGVQDISQSLRRFVQEHLSSDFKVASFDSTAGLLKSAYNIPFNFNQKQFVDKLLECIAALAPSVETLSFSQNSIHSLVPFSQLWYLLPSVKNLNFEGNQIASIKELDCIAKIRELTELILSNNPIQKTPDYFKITKGKFPLLHYLDRREVYRKGASAKPLHTAARLTPNAFLGTAGNFFDTSDSSSLVEHVFSKYFQLFDSERDKLVDLYGSTSSFCINSVVYDPSLQCKIAPKRAGYRVGFFDSSDAMSNANHKIQLGIVDITNFFRQLPSTQHDFSTLHFDAWQSVSTVVPIMNVFVSGQFIDSFKFKRSFSRVFVLAPSSNSSWPIAILNDVLTIVESCKLESVPFSTPSTSSELSIKIERLAQLTGLTRPYAEKCLLDNNLDLDRSLHCVQTLRQQNQIPPEAFGH